jgi:hypothetical protein
MMAGFGWRLVMVARVSAARWRAGAWLWIVSVLGAGVCVLGLPCVAAAGGYHYFACRVPYGPDAGRPAPVAEEDFAYGENEGPYLDAGNGCATGGSLFAVMDGETSHPYEAGASVTFTAPAGLTISGFALWRYESTVEGVPYGSPEAKLLYVPGPLAALAQCTGNCARGTRSEPLSPANEVAESSPGLGCPMTPARRNRDRCDQPKTRGWWRCPMTISRQI